MTVLVGYASAHGSTQGIAERIASRLGEHGVEAEARAMGDVAQADAYDGFVLGSAIHNGAWLEDGVTFAQKHLDVLSERPVWLFSVGTIGETSSMVAGPLAALIRRMMKEQPVPKGIAKLVDRITPREHRAFAGAIRREHYDGAGRFLFKAMGGRYGDHRDWEAIDAWAASIAQALGGVASPAQ